ncbi:MAG: M48 family metalloprotease, partial [Alphaproteobacteria bacterium]|nr:M48 family metalloprotease [Alphaproteobacteria bacterium]
MIRNISFLLFCVLCLLVPMTSHAQGNSPIIIRDTEIENTLKEWLAPLLKSAGMGPQSVDLIIVQSPQINAFVAGGANMFIYTGLIESTETPQELIGVMAHELGHISGGHLIAGRRAMERASYESILGMVVGVGAAIATGEGGLAQAAISGSQNIAMRRFLSHSRVQESSADQAALRFLDAAQIDPEGLVSFFGKLESEELMPVDQQSGYMRTHPLTRDRIDNVRLKAETAPAYKKPLPATWIEQHARMKAKLIGFTNPGQVTWVYNDRDKAIPAQYARAIAAYRNSEVEKSLKLVDALIEAEPENPYFHELKGQMLMDYGRVAQAVAPYQKALQIMPSASLIRIALARALMESNSGDSGLQEAIDHLERALQEEERSPQIHRLLATAYGRRGQTD